MIICDFNITRTSRCPFEAEVILVADANGVLTSSRTLQLLKVITWRYAQILQAFGDVKLCELAQCNAFECCKFRNAH